MLAIVSTRYVGAYDLDPAGLLALVLAQGASEREIVVQGVYRIPWAYSYTHTSIQSILNIPYVLLSAFLPC